MKILIKVEWKWKTIKDLENARVLQDHQDHRSNQRQRSWKQHTSPKTTKSKSDRESIDIIVELKCKKKVKIGEKWNLIGIRIADEESLKRVTENDSSVISFVDSCLHNLCVFVSNHHCSSSLSRCAR